MTTDQVLGFDLIAGSHQVITLGKREGVHAKAKFRRKLNPYTHKVWFVKI